MDLVEFIRRFMPKTPARVFHPAIKRLAAETHEKILAHASDIPKNGMSANLVIMDEVADSHYVSVITKDDKAVQLEFNCRESLAMTRIVNPMSMMEILNIHILNRFGAPLESLCNDYDTSTYFRIDGIAVSVSQKILMKNKTHRAMFRYLSRRFKPLFKRRDALRRTLRYATLEPHGA